VTTTATTAAAKKIDLTQLAAAARAALNAAAATADLNAATWNGSWTTTA
jgi:hypothetical protein